MSFATLVADTETTALTGMAPDSVLTRALASVSSEESKGFRNLIPHKRELLRLYDVPAMEDAVGVCYLGRSGSRLLTSFLDGHDHIVMLPMECSQRTYEFFVVHRDLSLRDKLLAYPTYTESYTPIFAGEFPITPADYFAAVEALLEEYGDRPPEFLSSSRTFFQFLHVAYALALGQRPAVPCPLMVYAQHRLNYHTARFVKDFPKARFLHTVRDPISSFDSMFAFYLKNAIEKQEIARSRFPMPALRNLIELATTDCPNRGMESRTLAVRFEDMHLNLERTMRAVADWLDLPYRSSLLNSTFNGVPWPVKRGNATWSGSRPEQAKRQSPNMWITDRALVFALFQENFVAWGYPCPAPFAQPWLRRLTLAANWILPTKIQLLNALAGLRFKIIPSLRAGKLRSAARALVGLFESHIQLMKRAQAELRARLATDRVFLRIIGTVD
jgi:hypothetical protein